MSAPASRSPPCGTVCWLCRRNRLRGCVPCWRWRTQTNRLAAPTVGLSAPHSNHRGAEIDFATLHAWPDNWLGYADFSAPLFVNPSFDYTHGTEVGRPSPGTRVVQEEVIGTAPARAVNRNPPLPPAPLVVPQVWREKLDALGAWIGAHIEDAAYLGKPLVIEEARPVPAVPQWAHNAELVRLLMNHNDDEQPH